MARVAVVGGGIFGSTVALYAARNGHNVVLIESRHNLLEAASAINQYRLHKGYHYPRSVETAKAAARAYSSFVREYAAALVERDCHYYAIAKENSLTTDQQYEAFCQVVGLSYKRNRDNPLLNMSNIAAVYLAWEARYDPVLLRDLIYRKLRTAGVQLALGSAVDHDIRNDYDIVVVAAYAKNNELCVHFDVPTCLYQYEICEKPVVRLPAMFARQSIVVLDGPFMCLDPFANTGLHVLGNVTHGIHHSNIGYAAAVPPLLEPLLNRGVVSTPDVTNFARFISSGTPYIPGLAEAEHVGSMYTIRTVLPHRDSDDARPTAVDKVADNVLRVFSGKIVNCVDAANTVVGLIAGKH
ncbi:FAD-dependent oxidoreductase [Mesorhizobium huakuii]|uniref:FAD-binding oxidoreductase n=1 Tax=Mesorhizobium huakuii TaxID=28104 RepID=A0A7G6T4S0_9HYPH|nr:FAD-dependent oxidoreductase [Mesorhizobium huakuii]QND61752.1 FAD-binding oxidoreductase [Mesorhizobium huakuii]QND69020.1 FAD-binding oxidoreductase [Mesorhizobium loti]